MVLTAWRLAVRRFDQDAVSAERQRIGEAEARAAESASASLRIVEARAATLENELVESNRKARQARLAHEEVSARLVEEDRATDLAARLQEQLTSVQIRAEEFEAVQAANKELCVQFSSIASSVRFEDSLVSTKIGRA